MKVMLLALLAWAALGQVKTQFEVASIRPSDSSRPDRVNLGLRIDGAQVHVTYFSLRDYIGLAYNVRDYQVSGPDWLASQRFDISAKLPAEAARTQVPEMIAALLAERFHLKLHRETKEFPVYAIVPGRGELKLKESAVDASTTADTPRGNVNVAANGGQSGVTVNLGNGSSMTFANNRFEATKLTMPSFADSIRRFLDRPVVDETGLTKAYDFTLTFTPEDFNAMMIRSAVWAGVVLPPEVLKYMDTASGDSLFSAIEALGLKLDRRKAPLEVVVVDQMNKLPSEN